MENFYTCKRPVSLQEARVINQLPKNIEGHIIVCGLIKGIKNLILPLRCKTLGRNKRPIVILTNDTVNGDTFVWPEINRFQDIYLIKGSALNPKILEKARAQRARSIIILAKQNDTTKKSTGQERMDAGNIFIYRTIVANYANVFIVTELEAMANLAFLVQDNDEISSQTNYYASKPFAAGEIYVGSLLDSLMCQAFYNKKIMDILDQFIMGNSNTPSNILKIYQQLNLSMCSINTVEIPKACTSLIFWNVFEHCLKHYNMIVLGVYKRHKKQDQSFGKGLWNDSKNAKSKPKNGNKQGGNAQSESENQNDKDGKGYGSSQPDSKPYVWIHPPKNIDLHPSDELFVLSDRNLIDSVKDDEIGGRQTADSSKGVKIEEKKTQEAIVNRMKDLNKKLNDLSQASKEWNSDVYQSKKFIKQNFGLKLRSDIEGFDSFT